MVPWCHGVMVSWCHGPGPMGKTIVPPRNNTKQNTDGNDSVANKRQNSSDTLDPTYETYIASSHQAENKGVSSNYSDAQSSCMLESVAPPAQEDTPSCSFTDFKW